jgi:hypothetical protein
MTRGLPELKVIAMASGEAANPRFLRLGPLGPLGRVGGRAAAATLRPLTGAVGAVAEAGITLEQRLVDRLLDGGELEGVLASPRLQEIIGQVFSSVGATQLIDTFFDSGLFDRLVDRLEPRVVDRLLEGGELEGVLASPRLPEMTTQVFSSEGVTQVVDTFFDSGLFDRVVDRLSQHTVDRLLGSGELEAVLASPPLQEIVARVVSSVGATQVIDTFFDSGLFDRFVDRLLSSDALWRLVDEIAASPAVRAAVSQQGLGFADQVGDAVRARSRRGDRRLERAAERLARRSSAESRQIPAPGDEDDGRSTPIS